MTAPNAPAQPGLDLGKPMRWTDGNRATLNVVYHDMRGALVERASGYRDWHDLDILERRAENIPPEPPGAAEGAHDDFSQAKGPPMLPFRNDRTTLPFGSTDKVSFSVGGATRMDQVNSPPHYNRGEKCPNCGHGIECIDVTEHRDFLVGNAIKYLWRAGAKDDFVKDLRKAAWYIERKIAQLEGPGEVK